MLTGFAVFRVGREEVPRNTSRGSVSSNTSRGSVSSEGAMNYNQCTVRYYRKNLENIGISYKCLTLARVLARGSPTGLLCCFSHYSVKRAFTTFLRNEQEG
eukprot:g75836.t1